MTERWRATCRGGDRGAGARPLAKPRCDHHEAGLPRTASARAHWWPTPRGMRLHSLSESESVSGTSLEASDTGGMSELSAHLSSTVTRRETEHSISNLPSSGVPAIPQSDLDVRSTHPADPCDPRDRAFARRPPPDPPPRSPPAVGGRCKRATARTGNGVGRGRAARDRTASPAPAGARFTFRRAPRGSRAGPYVAL